MTAPGPAFSFRSVALSALLPTFVFSIGQGAIIPMIPVIASSLGAGLAFAGFLGGLFMMGELLGDVPAGSLVARFGERRAMIGAAVLCLVGLAVCLLVPTTLGLAIGLVLSGLSTSVFALARHAFMTTYVPLPYRARALSTLGGTFRGGWAIGPFIAAALIHATGEASVVFWVHVVACVLVIGILFVVPDPTAVAAGRVGRGAIERAAIEKAQRAPVNVFTTIRDNRTVLSRMGAAAAIMSAVRSSRTVILPLWAVSIGMADAQTAVVIGIAGAVDFALFYTSGQIMDRFGRLWSAIPALTGLGLSHIVLAFTSTEGLFIAVAVTMALANGIGSGILMTVGADLSPRDDPARFLAAWRFTTHAGEAAAPLLISGITVAASLAVASLSLGALGLVGSLLFARYLPRYVPRSRPDPS
ncbi:MFS transporter [Labedella endophytica]|uniref:MFS transporter n=1 Tax=Labedella endophytica TaxID=1523160 RepID=A0A433JNY1_9MICO|nr:MFS transporter [Labedella endophytica]RUQ97650.1 MFS transporter [Labedella endophytica]